MTDNALHNPGDNQDHPLKVGEIVAGRFRIVSPVAQGTWSTIYRAYQTDLDRHVALKILKPSSQDDQTIVERFRREALFVSHLTHANTITFLDYGETASGSLYIAMEHLEGETLGQLISHGPLDPVRAFRIMVQICQSLSEVHSLGMLHRDLKPDNILVSTRTSLSQEDYPPDFVKVLDFGIAKATRHIQGMDNALDHLTSRGLLIGTPLYMAPEQVMEQELSPATDIYSLGHILYEMLTAQAPFDDGSDEPLQIIMHHIEDEVPPLPKALENHPLAAIIKRTTAKNPLERFPDADALLNFLLILPIDGQNPIFDLSTQPQLPSVSRAEIKAEPEEISDLEALFIEFDERIILNNPEREEIFEHILGTIEGVYNNAQGHLLVLRGESGSGKSTIINAVLDVLMERDFKTICVLNPQLDKRWTIREGGMWSLTDVLLGLEPADPATLSRGLLNAITEGFSGKEEVMGTLRLFQEQRINPSLSSIEVLRNTYFELFSALSQPLVQLSSPRMLVWVVEDLHDEDPLTLAFLQHLVAVFEQISVRLLIIASVNEDSLGPSVRKARSLVPLLSNPSKRVQMLRIKGLDERAAWSMLSRTMEHPLSQELAMALHRATDGHPRFMFEAIRHLQSRNDLVLQDGLYQLAKDRDLDERIPHRLSSLLQQRLHEHRYSAQSGALLRHTLETIALLGPEASERDVRTFLNSVESNLQPETLNLAIHEAIELEYIHHSHGVFQFVVPQTQQLLLEQINRTAAHESTSGDVTRNKLYRAASFLLERHPEPVPIVLHHIVSLFVMAGRRDKASRCLRKAAHAAYYRFDLDTAIDTYLQALRYARRPNIDSVQLAFVDPETDEELAVFLRLGECYAILGDIGLAQDYLTCALRGAQIVAKTSLGASIRGQAMQLKGDLALLQGNAEAAAWHFIQARRAFEKVGQDHGIARSIIERARIHLLEGQPHEALDPLIEALVLGEYIEVIPIQIQALTALSRTRLQLGDPVRAHKDAQQAIELLTRENDAQGLSNALINLGEILYFSADLAGAQQALQQAILMKVKTSERFGLGRARLLLAQVHAAQGYLEEALNEIVLNTQLCKRYHDPIGAVHSQLLQTDIEVWREHLSAPHAEIDERPYRALLNEAASIGDADLICQSLVRLALLRGREGHIEKVEDLFEEKRDATGAFNTEHHKALRSILAWLGGLREASEVQFYQQKLNELINAAQTRKQFNLLFLASILQADLYNRQGATTESHTTLQFACNQALLGGSLTEAAQSRLELIRLGAYGEEATGMISTQALFIGPALTLPLMWREQDS